MEPRLPENQTFEYPNKSFNIRCLGLTVGWIWEITKQPLPQLDRWLRSLSRRKAKIIKQRIRF
jgi:hypothetical protein